MKRLLVVTGSNGLLGKAIVNEAMMENIEVIGVTRHASPSDNVAKYDDLEIKLECLNSTKIDMLKSLDVKKTIINCAWAGSNGLTEGGLDTQLENIIFIESLINFMKEYAVHDMVNIGSMDEVIVERSYINKLSLGSQFSHLNYGIAKLAVRDILKFFTYINKINLIHAKISVIIDSKLERPNFIEKNLKSIFAGKDFIIPESRELYNISTDKYIAKQLISMLHKGENQDVVLGSGVSMTLLNYFNFFSALHKNEEFILTHSPELALTQADFYTDDTNLINTNEILSNLYKEIKIA